MKRRDARKRAEKKRHRQQPPPTPLGPPKPFAPADQFGIDPVPASADGTRRGTPVMVGGFSLAELARRLGASQSYISRLSRRANLPSMATAIALRDLLGVATVEEALQMLTADHDASQRRLSRAPEGGG